MRFSRLAATALLLNGVAVSASAAQGEAQASAPASGVDRDAQCAMFMRNIIVQLIMRGNLTKGERAYFDRYGVLFNYFAGRFNVGHDSATAVPVLTATVRGMSSDVRARMDCFNDGDRTMQDVWPQIDRAVPAGGSESAGTGAASPAPPSASGTAAEDGLCVAAVQRVVNDRARLIGHEGMRNPLHVLRALEFHAGRLVARGGSTAIEAAVAAAFAGLPSEQASADALGFRCVADATTAIDAFSAAIADAEVEAKKGAGKAGK